MLTKTKSLFLCCREAPKHRELRAGPAVRDLQRSEREAPATSQPLDQTSGHPVRHLPHRLLSQGEPDGEDAHPAAHRRKSMSRARLASHNICFLSSWSFMAMTHKLCFGS